METSVTNHDGWQAGLVEFVKAKAHHFPVEDQHALSVILAAAPTAAAQNTTLPPDVLHALRFYANGGPFSIDGDAQEFDTVSGEPGNFLFSQKDDDCTMIEDGGIAKAVLQGKRIYHEEDELESAPIEGEIYSSAPPAPESLPAAEIVTKNTFGLDVYEAELLEAGVNLPKGTKLYTHSI